MHKTFLLVSLSIVLQMLPSACSNDTNSYTQVSYGGNHYWYDYHGHYYRRYWYGYRPCPKPPGKPDHPVKPPVAKPPIAKPPAERPQTQPVSRNMDPPPEPYTPPPVTCHAGRRQGQTINQ